ncbi:MAG: hypothetical protein IJ752_03725 [Alphaproteobacteria bacterium]|nr:hypothetical protein [Alphaproteobacteria bacterium]
MVVMLGLAFLSFYIEEFLEKERYIHSCSGRFFSVAAAALLSFGLTLLLFGLKPVLSSPIPPDIYQIWAASVSELQPGFSGDFFQSVARIFLYVLMISLFAFPFCSIREKKLLITIAIPLLFLTFMTLLTRRFSRPCAVLSVFTLMLCFHGLSKNFKILVKIYSAAKILLLVLILGFYTASVFTAEN